MRELLEFLVKNIAADEKAVSVVEEKQDEGTTYRIEVSPEDKGKVIGKSGKVIKALRNILKIRAIKEGKRVFLEIV